MPTKKLVLVQGLDVAALAVNVLLIYFSKTARHITKESESGGRMGGGSAILWASYIILHNFHFASKIIPQIVIFKQSFKSTAAALVDATQAAVLVLYFCVLWESC